MNNIILKLIASCLVLFPQLATAAVAILDFDLRDLTLNPQLAEETRRTASLRPMLVEKLSMAHKIEVLDNPESAALEAAKGQGYLFERPDVAARIGREAGAEWIISGRLHKASFLFVYLKAQLINTRSGQIAADFVVEIKGQQKKLTQKGIETLAKQINDALQALTQD